MGSLIVDFYSLSAPRFGPPSLLARGCPFYARSSRNARAPYI